MKCFQKKFVVRIGILIALTGAAIPALAITSISSCPASISQPGNYQLTTDLTCAGPSDGITITASNVSLKLNGHTVTAGVGAGTNTIAVGVLTGQRVDHVGIQGPGLITNISPSASTGIYFQNADYSQVSQVTIVGASTGVSAFLCNYLTVASNVIGHGAIGVGMKRTNFSVVAGNDTSGNTDGISLFLGGGNTLNNNTANGNSNSGISIVGPGARVYGNVTNGNGQYGIFSQSSGNQAFSNTSSANGLFDLFDVGACAGAWSSNVFLTANAPCIH